MVEAALTLANGRSVPSQVDEAFSELPSVMARAGSLSGRTEAAVLDLAEAVILRGREGKLFDALVIEGGDGNRITVQLAKLPVMVRLNKNSGVLDEPRSESICDCASTGSTCQVVRPSLPPPAVASRLRTVGVELHLLYAEQ